MKTCSKCNIEKEDDQFYKHGKHCLHCRNVYKKKWNEDNKEEIAEKKAAYYAANKEKIKARRKAHYAANKERVKVKCKAYHAANKEKIKAYKIDWFKNNKEHHRIKNRNWRKNNPLKTREILLRGTSLKDMPEIMIETQALNNLIKHTLKQGDNHE